MLEEGGVGGGGKVVVNTMVTVIIVVVTVITGLRAYRRYKGACIKGRGGVA